MIKHEIWDKVSPCYSGTFVLLKIMNVIFLSRTDLGILNLIRTCNAFMMSYIYYYKTSDTQL